tara:strand:+ start:255 stop:1004 length:750 start_codon:yes stop_codon:yes gene_type:complete
MLAAINFDSVDFKIDLNQPLDISIPLRANAENVTAWYVNAPIIEPVRGEGFVGAVAEGGSVNFRNISFNPHGHGTHTECIGHITKEVFSVNKLVKQYFFMAKVVTIKPEQNNADQMITKSQIKSIFELNKVDALVVRTLPNDVSKLSRQYSSTNPAFIHHEAMQLIVDSGIEHLLIDTPSVDKEVDNGALLSHNIFWQTDRVVRKSASITEMVYVKNTIADGNYLLNLQFAPFENDASPSRPVLFKLIT